MRIRSKRLGVAATMVAAMLVAATGTASAQAKPSQSYEAAADDREPRTITVYGTGRVRGIPDVMELSIGVSTRARSAAEALGRNSELARKVLGVLQQAGVRTEDVQTSELSVSPVYDDDGNQVIGYAVNNTVTATIRDLDRVGHVVDAATQAAGDEIVVNGLYFSFEDNTKLVAQARTDAVKRAREQAEQLAGAAGVELGDLMSLTESSAPVGPAFDVTERDAAAESAPAPINPGAEELSVDVTLVYEIR